MLKLGHVQLLHPLFYMDVITYPFHNPDAGLANLLVKETPVHFTYIPCWMT